MTKLIILITGTICIFYFSSLAFSDDSLPSATPSSSQNEEETSFQVKKSVLVQDKVYSEPDESVAEQDRKQEPSDKKDTSKEEEGLQIADPLYPWNKGMFHFNDKFYFWVLKPAAKGYSTVVPEGMRVSFSNFYQNITTPIRFVNDLLQLKMKSAVNELIRLVVNSAFGVGGMGDFAKDKMGIKRHDEDTGQTFGHYGIGHGFYIVWPILGPSSLRDTVGLAGDLFLNPINYLTPVTSAIGIYSHNELNETSFHIGEYEDIKKSAINPYISIRDAYVQSRQKKVEE